MDVLGKILKWSKDRPAWQRDALRRLVLADSLYDEDFYELTELCKGAHGLSESLDAKPLDKSNIPTDRRAIGTVNLLSITHHSGVNALAENQKISFSSGLTVVYGDNAAGKSGYTRILKSACKARGAEEILGNVLSGTAPPHHLLLFDLLLVIRETSRNGRMTQKAVTFLAESVSSTAIPLLFT
jgi:hypothetical protein